MSLKFATLCTGIGGIDIGLRDAGLRCVWQSEIDAYCLKTLSVNFPEAVQIGNLCGFDFSTLETPDVLGAGFPCQPYSNAGKRNGAKHGGYILPEIVGAISKLRPQFVLLENVPGFLTLARGQYFAELLAGLAASGYDAQWDCVSASAFGAPQRRERLFILAYADRLRRVASKVFSRAVAIGRKKAISEKLWDGRIVQSNGGQFFRVPDAQPYTMVERFQPDAFPAIRAIGNAVIPAIAYGFGAAILESLSSTTI